MNSEPGKPASLFDTLWLGFKGRCPACAKGRMFGPYLKIADSCPECGEALHHHRADDIPAYFVILIVGHIVVTLALSVETRFHPDYRVHLALWLPLTLALSLLLLQPVKGAVAALQWHLGMHGFKQARKIRDEKAALDSPLK